MSTPTRLQGWQTTLAMIGDRFRIAYLPQNSQAVISTATVNDFKRELERKLGDSGAFDFITDGTVEQVQLLGRVVTADIRIKKSAPLLSLIGAYVVAGSPSVIFQVAEVYRLSPASSTAAAIVDAIKEGPPLFNDAYKAGEETRANLPNVLPTLGDQLGRTIAGILNPLIVPILLIGGGYIFFFNKTR